MNRHQAQVRRTQLLAAIGEMHMQRAEIDRRIEVGTEEVRMIEGRLAGLDPDPEQADGQDKH
jgi:hypothetical protein